MGSFSSLCVCQMVLFHFPLIYSFAQTVIGFFVVGFRYKNRNILCQMNERLTDRHHFTTTTITNKKQKSQQFKMSFERRKVHIRHQKSINLSPMLQNMDRHGVYVCVSHWNKIDIRLEFV